MTDGDVRDAPGRDAALFAWGVWAACAVAAFGMTAQFARDVAWWDDRIYLPLFTGQQTFSLGWLLRAHGDHLMPLPSAAWLALTELARGDVRAAAFVDDAVLAAIGAALLVAAKRVRGRIEYVDAVLPLAALQLGQTWTFLWGFQIQFVCSVALLATFLVAAMERPVPSRTADSAARAAVLVALPLCGGNGVATAIPLAAWALYAAKRSRKEVPSKIPATVLAAGALTSLALAAAVLLSVPRSGPSTTPRDALVCALQALGSSLGSAGRFGWFRRPDFLAWPPPVFSLAAAALAAATIALLARTAARRADERPRAAALAAGVASVLLVAFAIGWSRAGYDTLCGTWRRYVTLMVPLVWCAHFAWDFYGPPATRRFVQHALLAVLGATAAVGVMDTWDSGVQWRSMMDHVTAECRAGDDASAIARRHADEGAEKPEYVRALLDGQRRAKLGPFR